MKNDFLKNKEISIKRLIGKLNSVLTQDSFYLVDHWDADRMAIGIASGNDPRTCVYISTYKQHPDTFYFECECPIGKELFEYEVVTSGNNVTFNELLSVIRNHLKII